MENNYKRTIAGSVGAGVGALLNASGRKFYILEHKTDSKYHHVGESQKIIVDQVEMGRDSSCQVRFDESMETVSRKHAAIVRDGENYKLIPMSQTNATLVNGQPITGEWHLNSGDEIRLSSRGPVMGFIIPQGNSSLVKSIGLTERMSLFRQQALRPYKRALIAMLIVFILAVGGLVAWNIIQKQQADAKFEKQQQEILAQKEVLDDQKVQIDNAQKQIEEAQEQVRIAEEQLKNDREMSEQQRKEVEDRMNAQNAQINRMKKELKNNQAEYEKNLEMIKAKQEELNAQEEQIQEAQEVQEAIAEEEASFFAEINNCNDAVYYIKMDDVTMYNSSNQEIAHFDLENFIAGTGFMLEDGRFVTACRIIEPWYYYDTHKPIGYDNKGYSWTLGELQDVVNLGGKIVANFTAYSPSGTNFKCKNTDFTMPKPSEYKKEFLTVKEVRISNKTILKFFEVKRYTTRIYRDGAVNVQKDWATMAKREQLNVVKGLKFSNATSVSPVAGKEVNILGFPFKEGFEDSQSVNPLKLVNNINVTDLNDVGIIELASRRYQVGNDGAPVLQNIDGEWVVIGILSHTDSSDRDVVIPISYVR